MSADQLQKYYGRFYLRSSKLILDRRYVPKELWPLIPYAEFWGTTDEVTREELVEQAPTEIRQNLKQVVFAFKADWDAWLAGPDAKSRTPTNEYVAFSTLVMAAYSA